MKFATKRLSIYMFFSLVLSIVAAIIFINFLAPFMNSFIINGEIDVFKIKIFGTVVIIGSIVSFVLVFLFLINRKVRYINYLSREVKNIRNQGFGKTIEVRGQDELAQLCISINEMSLELKQRIDKEKEIENNKNELITNISHDLKTPLTSIIGYLELLSNEDIDEEIREKYTKVAYNKSLRLKELINELFEYTKLTNHDIKLEKVRFNISNLINQIVGESILGFLDRGIEVDLKNPYKELFCEIDTRLFTRVFENLLKNAEKYSDLNSIFKVIVEEKEKNIIISFINKCEEIKQEDLDKIFEKFYRLDKARSSDNEGSGLGLAITKRIVELHNGNLIVNKLNDYIEFKIILDKA